MTPYWRLVLRLPCVLFEEDDAVAAYEERGMGPIAPGGRVPLPGNEGYNCG